ncbi:helix-turn-helix domain-containing protein [Flavobacterium sp. RHBU_24]|uniref:helix-turn-helix domain-containing protein n=1 Tax=Flavobacterium sp. RHBU_24 TaxID=3391185 RepID=UPI0039852A16
METLIAKTQKIPEKILSRKDEIAADFLKLAEDHIADLMSGHATRRYHAKDFADKLFIHPRHLSNTLKLTLNTSPCEVMEERILEESIKLLKETDLHIAAIGQRFAYDEPTNFTKFFKSMTGQTPLQYRKKFV